MQNQNQQNCPSGQGQAGPGLARRTPTRQSPGAQGTTSGSMRSPCVSPNRSTMRGNYYECYQPVVSRVHPDYDPQRCCELYRRLETQPNVQAAPSTQQVKQSESKCIAPVQNLKTSSAGRATIDVDLSRGPGLSGANATTKKKSEERINRGAVRKPFADLKTGRKADKKANAEDDVEADVETEVGAPCGMTYNYREEVFPNCSKGGPPCIRRYYKAHIRDAEGRIIDQFENQTRDNCPDPDDEQTGQNKVSNSVSTSKKENAAIQIYQDTCSPQRPQQTAANKCPPSSSQKENIYQDPCSPQRPQQTAAQVAGTAQAQSRCVPKISINDVTLEEGADMCPENRKPVSSMSSGNFLGGGRPFTTTETSKCLQVIRNVQQQVLVLDQNPPGVIQEALDEKVNFNVLSFRLTYGKQGFAPSQKPLVEAISLLEAVYLRTIHEREKLRNCLLPSEGRKSGDKKQKLDIKEVEKYFASQYDSEVNRAIAGLLKAEIIADVADNQGTLFMAEIYKKISQLPGNELNEFQPMNFVIYAGTTTPK